MVVCRHHFDQSFSDEAGQLVPFQIERAGIVGLELKSAAIEPNDLAGDPIVVCE
jgi:hypothetical protein